MYPEKYITLLREFSKDLNKWKLYYAHGLEDLVLETSILSKLYYIQYNTIYNPKRIAYQRVCGGIATLLPNSGDTKSYRHSGKELVVSLKIKYLSPT